MTPSTTAFAYLGAAIVMETAATSILVKTEQFSRPLLTVAMAICYLISFYFLAQSLKVVPVGLAYAIWSGLGIVLISAIGFVAFGQRLDLPACIGIALIIAGVLVIRFFSSSLAH